MSITSETKITDHIPNIIISDNIDTSANLELIRYDALEDLSVIFGHKMPVHRHAQFLQMHYICNGEIDFQIEDKFYHVSGPCCFITPPSNAHSFSIKSEAVGHVLTVHQSIIRKLLLEGLHEELQDETIPPLCINMETIASGSNNQWRYIDTLFTKIADEWTGELTSKALNLKLLTSVLIIEIIRTFSSHTNQSQLNNSEVTLFHRFSDLVEDNYKQHWQLSQYLEIIGTSDSRLNSVCRRISNQAPKQLIHARLLLEAKRLLVFTKIPISDICYEIGFSDPAYFSRFFKKHTGQTALNYRAEHINNNSSCQKVDESLNT